MPDTPFTLVFYEDESGDEPVLRWIKEELDPTKRRAIGVALHEVLAHMGVDVCGGEFGKALGDGLFEFRLRHSAEEILGPRSAAGRVIDQARGKILLRVFFHPYGDKLILLLGGYDKGRFSSKKRQTKEISIARKRLEEWRRSQS